MRLSVLSDLLEKHRRFDEVVGTETDESILLADEVAANEAINLAEKLESLEQNQGWKILKTEMESSIEKHKEMLVHCLNEKEVIRIQEFIKARTQFLAWISTRIAEGKSLIEERKNQGPKLAKS